MLIANTLYIFCFTKHKFFANNKITNSRRVRLMIHMGIVQETANGPRLVAACGAEAGIAVAARKKGRGLRPLIVAALEVFLAGLNNPMTPRCAICCSKL